MTDVVSPIPDIAITKLPTPHLSFTADGTAKAAEPRSIIAGPSRPKSKSGTTAKLAPAPELDSRPYERKLSKKEKAAVCLPCTTLIEVIS